jgi:hypothetical protein
MILYTGGGMSTKEKHTWIYAVVSLATYLVYLGVIISRA